MKQGCKTYIDEIFLSLEQELNKKACFILFFFNEKSPLTSFVAIDKIRRLAICLSKFDLVFLNFRWFTCGICVCVCICVILCVCFAATNEWNERGDG